MNINKEAIKKVYYHPNAQAIRDGSRPAIFFLFPEIYDNPLPKLGWFPYLAFFLRGWMYGLVFHHIGELKSIMDFIPFFK